MKKKKRQKFLVTLVEQRLRVGKEVHNTKKKLSKLEKELNELDSVYMRQRGYLRDE